MQPNSRVFALHLHYPGSNPRITNIHIKMSRERWKDRKKDEGRKERRGYSHRDRTEQ